MNTVIYYPHFYPTTDWLKIAALCWDKVYRLSTPDAPPDPEPIQELNETLGNVLDKIYVDSIADSKVVYNQFEKWLEPCVEDFKSSPWSSDENHLEAIWRSKFPGGGFVELLNKYGLARIENEPIEVQIPKWQKDMFGFVEIKCITPKPEFFSQHYMYETLKQRLLRL